MLLENLEGLSIIMTEQKVKAPPPPTHTRTGQKIVIKKVETKPAKRGGGTDSSSSSSAGTSERGELIDGEDLGGDDSEDDEEELAPTGPGGSRPVLRREFMLTPKADMIEKPAKKTKEPTVQKEA